MESSLVEVEKNKLQETPRTRRKGGLLTMPFIIANESFEKLATYGIGANMIFYLERDYGMSVAKVTHLCFLINAGSNITPTVGAFLADSYLGRYLTIALGSFISLLGLILLWLTTMFPKLRPPPCNPLAPPCTSATSAQYGFLICSFVLGCIGSGGVRSSSIAFGADQLNKSDDPNNRSAYETFFNWYYVSGSVSVLIALTGIVYIQDHMGWKVGIAVPAILMFLSAFLFVIASPLYIKRPVTRSIFTGLVQVIVVAFKNRNLDFPPLDSGRYHSQSNSEYTVPTHRLRFLNKACIIINPEDVTLDGVAANPWNLCTVQQVEELKTLIRIIPMWSAGIMISIFISQTLPVLQASVMDRHLGPNFKIPAASFVLFLIITLIVWVSIYDRMLLPLASKIRGKPVSISPKGRMGIGLLISCIALGVAGEVEQIRRKKAIKNPIAAMDMSAMWLIPQFALYGIAEAFCVIGQIDFYYTEFPSSMKSIGSSLYQLSMGAGNLLASLIVNLVDKYTQRDGKESWLANDINKGHYDYYYWLLAIINVVNLLFYTVCSWAYESTGDNKNTIEDNNNVQKIHTDQEQQNRVFLDA